MAAIHRFAKRGDMAEVLRELARGVGVDVRDEESGRTALMEAVGGGAENLDVVRALLERGADVNAWATEACAGCPDVASALAMLEQMPGLAEGVPNIEKLKAALQRAQGNAPSKECVLSLALGAGDYETVKLLVDAGAGVRYVRPNGYSALIDVLHGRDIRHDAWLAGLVRLLIERGAHVNVESSYGESALSVASRCARFDVVEILLEAGADAGVLRSTALIDAVERGTAEDVARELGSGGDLESRDRWQRTAWLVAVQTGDLGKARLLTDAGADIKARGRCGKTALMMAVDLGNADMIRWVLSLGLDVNETDDSGRTALMEAAEAGEAPCVRALLEAGADLEIICNGETAMKTAVTLEVVKLLVEAGGDLNQISDEMRAEMTGLRCNEEPEASEEEFQAGRERRFGRSNPERMDVAFWRAMVRGGGGAYLARRKFGVDLRAGGPVWCFHRFGKSISVLPDGRIVEIGGEHEDYYDPDFCIYNDVVMHSGGGRFEIFGYPEEVFPPTDSHSATLVGNFIYIIGGLGYLGKREFGETPVFRLDVRTCAMEKTETTGEKPGWIFGHRARIAGEEIVVSGGEISVMADGKEEHQKNGDRFALNLATMRWRREREI